jgi:chromate reductase, NAD(P)H dehydrogenase (quinone)
MDGKPVAIVNVAVGGRGKGAQETLRMVLGYVGADIVEPACRYFPLERSAIEPDGTVADPGLQAVLAQVWDALLSWRGGR